MARMIQIVFIDGPELRPYVGKSASGQDLSPRSCAAVNYQSGADPQEPCHRSAVKLRAGMWPVCARHALEPLIAVVRGSQIV